MVTLPVPTLKAVMSKFRVALAPEATLVGFTGTWFATISRALGAQTGYVLNVWDIESPF